MPHPVVHIDCPYPALIKTVCGLLEMKGIHAEAYTADSSAPVFCLRSDTKENTNQYINSPLFPLTLRDIVDSIASSLSRTALHHQVALDDDLYVDTKTHELLSHQSGKNIPLTDKEENLLLSLNNGPQARQSLLENIWGFGENLETHTLETHLYRLRQKLLEVAGDRLSIVMTGDGYCLQRSI